MKVLVTGAAGFIGCHVAKHLKDAGHEVLGIDNLSGGFQENVPAGVAFEPLDIRDAKAMDRLFEKHRFDVVCHLAAYAAEGLSHFVRRFNYENNLVGSINLLNPALRHKCKLFLFTSSIAVYGAGQLPMQEAMVPQPEDPYGIGKYAFELELASARSMFGLNYVTFRPHNVYGEAQNVSDPFRNVIGIFMRQAMINAPLSVFGDGLQTRAFSHIDDVAPILAQSVDLPATWNQTYNVGADQPHTVLDIVRELESALGKKLDVKHLPARHEVVHAYADHSKVLNAFGHKPKVSLHEGIQRMTAWVRERGIPERSQVPDIELADGLPASWQQFVKLAK